MPLFPALLNKAHLISSDWVISMRSLRDRIFRSNSSGESRGSSKKNKSTDNGDFVQLKPVSGSSSLKDLGYGDGQNITKVKGAGSETHQTDIDGIKVTTDYTIGIV